MDRRSNVERKTKETDIKLRLDIDGKGAASIDTGIPFFDHMLTLMAAHGFMDIQLSAKGDTDVDYHHTVEDLGICIGMAIKQALGEMKGIKRYGQALVPMDESLASIALDISNRPFLAFNVDLKDSRAGLFDINLLREFFKALVNYSGITLHVTLRQGSDAHHAAEAIFKAFGKSLDQATGIESRLGGEVLSTKGIL